MATAPRSRPFVKVMLDEPSIDEDHMSVNIELCKETLDDGQLCAFELLAAVAGKLLQESDSSSASSNAAAVVGNHSIRQELYKEKPQHHVNDFS